MNVQRGKIVSGGRLQLPAEVRKKLGLEDGDTVLLEVTDNELRIRSQREGIRRIQERLQKYGPQAGEAFLSDELVADRRRDSGNE